MDSLSEGMPNPANIIGIHYFNPGHIIPLVEVHRGSETSDAAYEQTERLMEASGKKTVLVRKEMPGFIVNRLMGALEREIDYLLDKGIVTPEDLDIAVKSSTGFRFACLGPMEVDDMIGLDISMVVSGRVFKGLSTATEPSPALVEKVNRGELGIKSGKGWYDYSGKTREEVLEEKNSQAAAATQAVHGERGGGLGVRSNRQGRDRDRRRRWTGAPHRARARTGRRGRSGRRPRFGEPRSGGQRRSRRWAARPWL